MATHANIISLFGFTLIVWNRWLVAHMYTPSIGCFDPKAWTQSARASAP